MHQQLQPIYGIYSQSRQRQMQVAQSCSALGNDWRPLEALDFRPQPTKSLVEDQQLARRVFAVGREVLRQESALARALAQVLLVVVVQERQQAGEGAEAMLEVEWAAIVVGRSAEALTHLEMQTSVGRVCLAVSSEAGRLGAVVVWPMEFGMLLHYQCWPHYVVTATMVVVP